MATETKIQYAVQVTARNRRVFLAYGVQGRWMLFDKFREAKKYARYLGEQMRLPSKDIRVVKTKVQVTWKA